jgi:hypothetical protein
MIYCKTIASQAGGSEDAATFQDMYVTSGLIYQVEFYFPPGSSGLLHVAVMDGGYQCWPSEPGETFFGDNTLITFPDRYYISSSRKAFTVKHWNEDDTFNHIFQLRIGQVSEEIFIASFLPSLTLDKITESLAKASEANLQASRVGVQEAIEILNRGKG